MQTKPEKIEEFYTAFLGNRLIVRGPLEQVLRECKALLDGAGDGDGGGETLLLFEDMSGRQCDFDFRGTVEDVLERALPAQIKAGPGRPKLGVISREISLLPRHWEWLERDPQGISAALRRLVEEARKRDNGAQERVIARDAASRFMWCMAGNLVNFEEASRALFAGERDAFFQCISDWPSDIRDHLATLTRTWF